MVIFLENTHDLEALGEVNAYVAHGGRFASWFDGYFNLRYHMLRGKTK
jgi:hypothetical protein